MTRKQVLGVYTAPQQHWVGDGFPVRSLFSYHSHGAHLSPFLLLDYAGPARFEPSDRARGVGEHPHRGFETVTIVYQGEVAHRDSTGAGGTIGPGDVQWMTAASGVLHDEFHSPEFTRNGGTLEMVQLWVNLPARDKMSAPGYQHLAQADIPEVPLANDAGRLRVIAGDYDGRRGAAKTFTPVDVWDVRLRAGHDAAFALQRGRTAAMVVLRGDVTVNGEAASGPRLVVLEREGEEVLVEATSDATLLILSGEPLQEPVVGHGPFVMNSEREIHQAMLDFSRGRFGRMSV
jgi:quercetin 2,3-dioxygenase